MAKSERAVPTLGRRRSPSSGQWLAYAKFNGRTISFGAYDDEAKRFFDAFLSRWIANNRQIPDDEFEPAGDDPTIDVVGNRYLIHLRDRHDAGWIKNNWEVHRLALRPLRQQYGPEPAWGFSPLRLQGVRRAMLEPAS